MDPNQRTSNALLGNYKTPPCTTLFYQAPALANAIPPTMTERADADIAHLLRRFENIIAFSPDESSDRNSAAVGAYQREVDTAALIRAAEDILSLTRVLKESWLFGKLQTVGTSEAEKRAEEAAAKVAAGLARLEARDGAVTAPTDEQAMDIDSYNGGYQNGPDP